MQQIIHDFNPLMKPDNCVCNYGYLAGLRNVSRIVQKDDMLIAGFVLIRLLLLSLLTRRTCPSLDWGYNLRIEKRCSAMYPCWRPAVQHKHGEGLSTIRWRRWTLQRYYWRLDNCWPWRLIRCVTRTLWPDQVKGLANELWMGGTNCIVVLCLVNILIIRSCWCVVDCKWNIYMFMFVYIYIYIDFSHYSKPILEVKPRPVLLCALNSATVYEELILEQCFNPVDANRYYSNIYSPLK